MIRRLPQIAFGFLALATIGAFFLVQALKTEAPVFWTTPNPIPAVINPIIGRKCISSPTKLHPRGVSLNYKATTLAVSVTRADTVGVYIVSANNPSGPTVATLSNGTPMRAAPGANQDSKVFRWNGLLADGQFASAGVYYFRIVLEAEGKSVNLSLRPVQVITQVPQARILSVRLLGTDTRSVTDTTTTAAVTGAATTETTQGRRLVVLRGPAVLAPPHGKVRITFTRGKYRRVWIDIYRTDVAGGPELAEPPLPVRKLGRNWITWNGKIEGKPAPAGTYLVGITAQDLACDKVQWPHMPVASGSTAGAGVTIRYLSVTPPLTPTVSGGSASIEVGSARGGFSWKLRRAGTAKVSESGIGAAGRSVIHVRMPRRHPGLYTLTVRAGNESAAVPLVASEAGQAGRHARVLVVLPMLTWMGDTPVDDSGDGVPDTLRDHSAVSLARPLVDGPPGGFGADATLLRYLDAQGLSYQLTTDVALAEGSGPSLADRGGVIFPEGEDFLPAGLELTLRGFVRGGGRLLALGTQSFSGISHISGFPVAPRANAPRWTPSDPFGARHGQLTPTGGELISSVSDDAFNLFGDAGEFGGFSQYQPITPPAGGTSATLSAIGIGSAAPAIVAFHYGSGSVVEVGLSGFAASLAHNGDSEHLLANVWQLLSQ